MNVVGWLFVCVLCLCLVFGGCYGCTNGIGPNYSNGTRTGVITKLSEKGVIWKSWEGELLIALPQGVASATQPEKFEFNVDPQHVPEVKAALDSGKRVEIVYRQWWLQPMKIDNDHVIVEIRYP